VFKPLRLTNATFRYDEAKLGLNNAICDAMFVCVVILLAWNGPAQTIDTRCYQQQAIKQMQNAKTKALLGRGSGR